MGAIRREENTKCLWHFKLNDTRRNKFECDHTHIFALHRQICLVVVLTHFPFSTFATHLNDDNIFLSCLFPISQDEIQSEIDANANARQNLDELSKEVNQMKAEFTKNNESQGYDTVSDAGDGGNKQRAVLGEIDTIKKIIDILETVVVPTIVDSQNAAKSSQNKATATGSASVSSDPIKILPKGLKLLQHHSIIADDGQSANNQIPNPQSDDN